MSLAEVGRFVGLFQSQNPSTEQQRQINATDIRTFWSHIFKARRSREADQDGVRDEHGNLVSFSVI